MSEVAELDLGAFDDTVLVFGGPYGNLEATGALLAEGARLNIPPRRMICTGDVAAYCADPVATAGLLRAMFVSLILVKCMMGALGRTDIAIACSIPLSL